MQQDFQFGIRQIVDMALKAISPAINDPSTANTCLDHLIALATDHPPHQQRAFHHACLLEQGLSPNFVSDDREELNARLAALRALVNRTPAPGQGA